MPNRHGYTKWKYHNDYYTLMVHTKEDTGKHQDKYIMFEDLENNGYAIELDKAYRKHTSDKHNKERDIV
eukprot:11543836-Heterocapsa_arctica.AAC.1